MKNIKVISLIFVSGLFAAGCNSISEPPVSAQVFNILTAQSAQVTAATPTTPAVTISSVDAASSSDGLGGITVTGTNSGDLTFGASDLTNVRNDAYILAKPADTSVPGFTTSEKLVVGGARNNLKYGDYGYWMETITAADTSVSPVYNWASFTLFDPANASQSIPTNDSTNYAYSGKMLGGLNLYDVDNNLVEVDEVTGNITLNANFFNNSLSGTMNFMVGNTPWYNGTITSTGGAQADGSFTGTITLDNSYSGKFALTSGAGAGYVTTLSGQFLGPATKIPAEAVGQFSIICNPGSVNNYGGTGKGYRPEVYGSFGVKK
ncbi:MAG: hypothetical protein FWF35_00545 [Elusimicrobia bacterium]|nr:hypothetical protein [Elusimicrobiota bacterium]